MRSSVLALAILLAASPNPTRAQATKPVLVMTSFELPVYSYERNQLAATLKGTLMSALQESKVVTVVDRTDVQRVNAKSLNARYLVYGTIDRMDLNQDYKAHSYSVVANITVNLLDGTTGEVLATKQLNATSEPPGRKVFGVTVQTSSGAGSPTDAYALLAKNVAPDVATFFQSAIPVEYPIASASEVAKDSSAGNLLIGCGSGCGIEAGQKYQIVEHTNVAVAGKTLVRSKDVGRVTITKVEDANFSIGALEGDGAKESLRRLAAKATLVLVPVH